MQIRKIRGENKIAPIRLSRSECEYAKSLGQTPNEYVQKYVDQIARNRKWGWYFERKKNEKESD